MLWRKWFECEPCQCAVTPAGEQREPTCRPHPDLGCIEVKSNGMIPILLCPSQGNSRTLLKWRTGPLCFFASVNFSITRHAAGDAGKWWFIESSGHGQSMWHDLNSMRFCVLVLWRTLTRLSCFPVHPSGCFLVHQFIKIRFWCLMVWIKPNLGGKCIVPSPSAGVWNGIPNPVMKLSFAWGTRTD